MFSKRQTQGPLPSKKRLFTQRSSKPHPIYYMMSRSECFAYLALAYLLFPVFSQATVVVTLAKIPDLVRAHNPELTAARLQIREAAARMDHAGRLSNPEIEAAIEHNARFREGKIEIGISQRFPVTARLQKEKEVSLAEWKACEMEVRDGERKLITLAQSTLVNLLALRHRRALLHQQLEVADTFSTFLAEVAAKGEGSALDVGQARLEASTLAIELHQLDAQEAVFLGELSLLLGMEAGQTIRVDGDLPAPEHLASPGMDLNQRADYQGAHLQVQAAAYALALEMARRHDDVEGGLFAAYERAEDAPEGYQNEALVGLRVKVAWPFWNKNEGAIHAAEAKKERMEKEAETLGRRIRLEIEAACSEMREWSHLIREIEIKHLPLADEQTRRAEAAYRAGQGDIQSLLRAREKHLQLAASKVDALQAYHLARVRFESALGNL